MRKLTKKQAANLADHLEINDMLGNIPEYINSGGCGIAALYLYSRLNKYGVEAKIVASTENSPDEVKATNKKPKPEIKDWYSNNFHGFNHVVVALGNLKIDARGYASLYSSGVAEVSPYALAQSIRLLGEWNNVYDRAENKRVKESLNAVVDMWAKAHKLEMVR